MFEEKYSMMVLMMMRTVTNLTGCLAPCSFREYRLTGATQQMVRGCRPEIIVDQYPCKSDLGPLF